MNRSPDALTQTISALASARSQDDVATVVRNSARGLVGADGVTFVLRSGDECYYVDEDAIAPLWKGSRFPLNACISGWVMLHAQIVVIRDIYADSRIPHDAYRPTFVRSLAMVPVPQTNPVACIGAYWAQPHDATWSEQYTLQALANAAGVALTNMKLYEELRASAVGA
jgi:two-component system, chemotaxis family, CheB/CheR fusion protein